MKGMFKGWVVDCVYGFVATDDGNGDVFFHISSLKSALLPTTGDFLEFEAERNDRGRIAKNVTITSEVGGGKGRSVISGDKVNSSLLFEEIEELDTSSVDLELLKEIASWKREAKAEDSNRYFWHVTEVDQISNGEKHFVIGRKGSGKTAICEHFDKISRFNVFSEKLSFKQFPFNDLYDKSNSSYTVPNQYITIWKYLIYSTICRLMIKNHEVDPLVREELGALFEDASSLSRRVKKWTGDEFGFSIFGLSLRLKNEIKDIKSIDWIDRVDYLEDILRDHAGSATYYVLFDELDEDYRDVINADQHNQYTALITSLFKAVQDIRTTFDSGESPRLYPIVFLRDDIYDIVQDNDKNKWGDFKVDLDWDTRKIKKLVAFRVSRALDSDCSSILPFDAAWQRVFGVGHVGVGSRAKTKISTFDYIARSTLLRPRDFVAYLQNCAEHAIASGSSYSIDSNHSISPRIVKIVDKGFSNYLRSELSDELFAILPDVSKIFDAISQLRKWNFSIDEFKQVYMDQHKMGFIKEDNFNYVLQVLFMFDVIGNQPRVGWFVFRYKNKEARLNFKERVVVHRGLFKSLQII